jgi:hypothetical protein
MFVFARSTFRDHLIGGIHGAHKRERTVYGDSDERFLGSGDCDEGVDAVPVSEDNLASLLARRLVPVRLLHAQLR